MSTKETARLKFSSYFFSRFAAALGSRLALAGWQAIIFFGLLLPLLFSLSEFKQALFVSLPWQQLILPCAHSSLNLAVIALLLLRKNSPSITTLATLGVCFFISRLTVYLAIDQQLYSDFARMWADAVYAHQNGLNLSTIKSGRTLRALTFLYPIVLIHGDNPIWYQIYNAIYLSLALFITYHLGARLWNRRVASVAVALLFLSGELLFSGEVPSHDIPGSLITLVCLALLIRIHDLAILRKPDRRPSHLLSMGYLALALGGLYAVLNFVRGISFLLNAAVGFYLACLLLTGLRERVRPPVTSLLNAVFFMMVIPILVSSSIQNEVVRHLDPQAPAISQRRQLGWIAGHAPVEGRGRFSDYQKLHHIIASVPDSELPSFAYGLFLSNIVDAPSEKFGHLYRKMRQLYFLGSQPNFYVSRLQPNAVISDRQTLKLVIKRIFGWNGILNAIFAVLLFLSICHYFAFRIKKVRIKHLPLATIAVVSLALLAFGEVQPRFIYPIWFIGSLYIAQFLVLTTRGRISYTSADFSAHLNFLSCFTLIAALSFLTFFYMNSRWTLLNGRILNLQEAEVSAQRLKVNRYTIESNSKGGTLELKVNTANLPEQLQGVLALTGISPHTTCGISVRVLEDKSLVLKREHTLKAGAPIWLSFPSPKTSGSLTFDFRLLCPEHEDAAKLEFGYIRNMRGSHLAIS